MAQSKFTCGGYHGLFLDLNSLFSRSRPVTFAETLNFVKKVKARDHGLYLSLFAILSRRGRSSQEAYQELVLLFQDHSDLLEDVARFRPPVAERKVRGSCSLCWILFSSIVVALSLYLCAESPLNCLLGNVLEMLN